MPHRYARQMPTRRHRCGAVPPAVGLKVPAGRGKSFAATLRESPSAEPQSSENYRAAIRQPDCCRDPWTIAYRCRDGLDVAHLYCFASVERSSPPLRWPLRHDECHRDYVRAAQTAVARTPLIESVAVPGLANYPECRTGHAAHPASRAVILNPPCATKP